MIMARTLSALFLALSLVLTSLAATVAQTRMAAAGVVCGPGGPMIVLDAQGLPVLDAEGSAIAAPDCPTCHIVVAVAAPHVTTPAVPATLTAVVTVAPVAQLSEGAPTAPRARAPPV